MRIRKGKQAHELWSAVPPGLGIVWNLGTAAAKHGQIQSEETLCIRHHQPQRIDCSHIEKYDVLHTIQLYLVCSFIPSKIFIGQQQVPDTLIRTVDTTVNNKHKSLPSWRLYSNEERPKQTDVYSRVSDSSNCYGE